MMPRKQKEAAIKTKEITETKATCKACGNVWFYDHADKTKNFTDKMDAVGDELIKNSCCCLLFPLGALFQLAPKKKVVDLNRCPKCSSKAVHKEEVIHTV